MHQYLHILRHAQNIFFFIGFSTLKLFNVSLVKNEIVYMIRNLVVFIKKRDIYSNTNIFYTQCTFESTKSVL